MVGSMHPCRHCDALIPLDSKVCPMCGKVNPLGSLRCPNCREPIANGYVRCSSCGLSLEIACPACKNMTFFGDYCSHCGARLFVICPECKTEQLPINEKCVKCNTQLIK